MSKIIVTIGLIIAITGIVVTIASVVPIQDSYVWLNESFVVSELGYYTYWGTFPQDTILHITFSVLYGGDRSIDFWVMDWLDFQKFNASEAYEYYSGISRESISVMNIEWDPPSSVLPTYFVWDNRDSFESKTVSAHFKVEFNRFFLPPIALVAGLLVFFGGLSTVGYGKRPPTRSRAQQILIVIGYFLASLGGIFGLFIGLSLLKKEDPEDKLHGKWITAIALISTFTFLGLYALL